MKKLLLTLMLVLGLSFLSYSQDQAYSKRLIERLNNEIVPPQKLAKFAHHHRGCITPLLVEAKKNYSLLTSEARKAFKMLAGRPVLTSEQVYKTTHYSFHYTTASGTSDSVSAIDNSNNLIPDFIDTMAAVFENVYQTDQTTYGYYMPPSDGTAGGDSRFDVYVYDIGVGLYGYCSPENIIGDNPNSPSITEIDASTSYMAMNKDYSWAPNITWSQAIKVTAAHEFFHAVQFGITSNSSQFFAESTAAWMEDVIYEGIDDNLQYITSIFDTPDVALDINTGEYSGSTYDGHWYGGWIFWRYLREHVSVDVVKKSWINAITMYENDAYEAALSSFGTDLRTQFNNWLISDFVISSNAAYDPYTYMRASIYNNYLANYSMNQGLMYEDLNLFNFQGTDINWSSTTNGNSILMRLSGDYFYLTASQNFSVTLNPTDTTKDLDLYLIKMNSSNNNFSVQKGTKFNGEFFVTVTDASSYDHYGILVSRFNDNAGNIQSAQYTLKISLNSAPAVSIVTPTKDTSVVQNASVVISADAFDSDGTIASVDFYDGLNLIGSSSSAPYSIVWSPSALGSHTITAKAVDNLNSTTTSSAINITVNSVSGVDNSVAYLSNVYPNPVKDQFVIEYSSTVASSIEIVDYTGMVVYNSSLTTSAQGKHFVSTVVWNNGIYFILIKNEQTVLAKGKIVVTK